MSDSLAVIRAADETLEIVDSFECSRTEAFPEVPLARLILAKDGDKEASALSASVFSSGDKSVLLFAFSKRFDIY
jgi:hypothetical protein